LAHLAFQEKAESCMSKKFVGILLNANFHISNITLFSVDGTL